MVKVCPRKRTRRRSSSESFGKGTFCVERRILKVPSASKTMFTASAERGSAVGFPCSTSCNRRSITPDAGTPSSSILPKAFTKDWRKDTCSP